MNAKDIRKYVLINKLLSAKPEAPEIVTWLSELAGIDFSIAFEVWEFLLNFFAKETVDFVVASNIEAKPFAMFATLSETNTRRLLLASDPLIRLIYGSCATSCMDANLRFLTNLILSAKPEAAEPFLAAARANSTGDFGERMRFIVDSVFKTYCKSKDVKKCELTRKQSTLLLEYCAKIKGANKMLLTQRIKEL